MIGVYGLGNVLRRDDGFGPSAVRRLVSRWAFPDTVRVEDLGTPGLDLPMHLVDLQTLLFVDTVSAVGAPGTIVVLDKAAILDGHIAGRRQTTHEAGVREAILTADLIGRGADDVLLIGAIPTDLSSGPGLSPAVEAAIDPTCARILAELRRRGVRPRPCPTAMPTGAWWEAGAQESS
jgi:hydrogenase maturation protease